MPPYGADRDVERALAVLRGSKASYAQAWLVFVVSLGLCAYGTFDYDVDPRKFFGLAAWIMASSAFTVAKTYPDRIL